MDKTTGMTAHTPLIISQMRDGYWVELARRDAAGVISFNTEFCQGKPEVVKHMLQYQVALCTSEPSPVSGRRSAEISACSIGFEVDSLEFLFLEPIKDPKSPNQTAFVQPIVQISHVTKNLKLSALLVVSCLTHTGKKPTTTATTPAIRSNCVGAAGTASNPTPTSTPTPTPTAAATAPAAAGAAAAAILSVAAPVPAIKKKELLIDSPVFSAYQPSITKDQIILHCGLNGPRCIKQASISDGFRKHFDINVLQLSL